MTESELIEQWMALGKKSKHAQAMELWFKFSGLKAPDRRMCFTEYREWMGKNSLLDLKLGAFDEPESSGDGPQDLDQYL